MGNPPLEAAPTPNQVRARIVIDASYEGDVAAWSGADFDLGREARSATEPHAGIIHTATHGREVNRKGYLPPGHNPPWKQRRGGWEDHGVHVPAKLALRPPRQPRSIAIGDWAIECRPCHDILDVETDSYEGAMMTRALRAPYQVPFGCLVPERVENLLVTTTISASHVAFCALRIEAVWTQTGTAAALAASLSTRLNCRVAEVPAAPLQARMLALGCKLTYFFDLESNHRDFAGVQWLALKGFLPGDQRFRCFPDMPATWADLVEAVVRAFDIPISVTGLHFDGLNPEHAAFRYAETLYDTASRAGVPLFPNMRHPVVDEPADHLRPERRSRWLDLPMDQPVKAAEASTFLERLLETLALPAVHMAVPVGELLTRGTMATLLHQALRADSTSEWSE